MPSKRAKPSQSPLDSTREEIRHVTGQSSLGHVLVAHSEKGVAAILVGVEPRHLLQDLQEQFRNAHLVIGNRNDERVLRRVIDAIEAPCGNLDLALDVRGTPFQKRVWQAVREIPFGETVTFSDVARKIGEPKAMRAVGNACSISNFAIVIPCHRVLRSDGSIPVGNFWARERRRALLDREAAASRKSPSKNQSKS